MLIFNNAESQEAQQKVIATAGRSFEHNNIGLEWTLGEVVIHTLENSSNVVSQGFHQPAYTLVSANNLPDFIEKYELFPNPVTTQQKLKITLNGTEDITIRLSDLSGKTIWQKNLTAQYVDEVISYENIPGGGYLLSTFINNYQIVQSVKTIKLD